MTRITLYVLGLSCIDSIHSIEKFINNLRGITSVKCTLPKGKVEIRFHQSLVSSIDIMNKIEDQGFAILKKSQQRENSIDIYN